MTFEVHPAVRLVREGRYTMIVPEVDLAPIGDGSTLHVLNDGRPICGRSGDLGETLEGCDPRAEVVSRKVVCGNCRIRLGFVPSPVLADDVDGGNSLGITRTELDRLRRRAAA